MSYEKEVKDCENCHGTGIIDTVDENGNWEEEECPWCEGSGLEED